MMYTEYAKEMNDFAHCIYEVKYTDFDYVSTLKEYGVMEYEDLKEKVLTADEKLLKAIMTQLIRDERFNSGAWIAYEEDGLFEKALRRLGVIYGYSFRCDYSH